MFAFRKTIRRGMLFAIIAAFYGPISSRAMERGDHSILRMHFDCNAAGWDTLFWEAPEPGKIEMVRIANAFLLGEKEFAHLSSFGNIRDLRLLDIGGPNGDFHERLSVEDFTAAMKSLSSLENVVLTRIQADYALQAISANHGIQDIYLERATGFSANGTRHLQVLPKLHSLHISVDDHSPLTDDMLFDIGKCFELNELMLQIQPHKELNLGGLGAVIGGLPITKLGLFGIPLTDESFSALLRQLPNLEFLSIEHDEIPVDSIVKIAELGKLAELYLDSSSPFNDHLAMLLPKLLLLKTLSIGEYLSDEGMPWLADIPGLERLYIGGSKITDMGLRAYAAKSPEIQWLSLEQADISDAGLLSIDGLTQLRIFRASSATNITDLGVSILANIHSLEAVHLPKCRNITSRGIEKLASAENMKRITVGMNSEFSDESVNVLIAKFPNINFQFRE